MLWSQDRGMSPADQRLPPGWSLERVYARLQRAMATSGSIATVRHNSWTNRKRLALGLQMMGEGLLQRSQTLYYLLLQPWR